jgi:hypothetical protein
VTDVSVLVTDVSADIREVEAIRDAGTEVLVATGEGIEVIGAAGDRVVRG